MILHVWKPYVKFVYFLIHIALYRLISAVINAVVSSKINNAEFQFDIFVK